MKVIILAAGQGTRLRPNRGFLWYILLDLGK
jgi:NDP-sugar pyrophosphorylase family protein